MENKNKSFEVVISERAADMLVQHVRFLSETSPQAAEKLSEEIIQASKSLQNFPERNPWLTDPFLTKHKYRKMTINKRYLLIYQIKEHNVHIDFILDCRQDYRWLL